MKLVLLSDMLNIIGDGKCSTGAERKSTEALRPDYSIASLNLTRLES